MVVPLALGVVAVTAALASASASSAMQRATYTYTGDEQTFTVPAGVTSLYVTAVGAPGAQGAYSSTGGRGAKVAATIDVHPGQVLYVEVGAPGYKSQPGFNGGGAGGLTAGCDQNGGAGGGASDVRGWTRSSHTSEATRLIVAGGGGGGGGGASSNIQGGAGGDAGHGGSKGSGMTIGAGLPGIADDGTGLSAPNTTCPTTGGGGGGGGLKGGGSSIGGDSTGGGGGGGGTSLCPGNCTPEIDTTGVPSVTIAWVGPTVSLATPTATWTLDSSTLLTWSATAAPGSPLAKFQVSYRRAAPNNWFNSYLYPPRWQALSPTTRQLRVPLAPGTTSCYSVRAIDKQGRQSEWANDRCTTSPLDDRSLSRSGRWVLTKSSSAYRGTLSISKVRGSKLTFAANKLMGGALVATKCPTCGAVTVNEAPRFS